jgi:hypothetical protein
VELAKSAVGRRGFSASCEQGWWVAVNRSVTWQSFGSARESECKTLIFVFVKAGRFAL